MVKDRAWSGKVGEELAAIYMDIDALSGVELPKGLVGRSTEQRHVGVDRDPLGADLGPR